MGLRSISLVEANVTQDLPFNQKNIPDADLTVTNAGMLEVFQAIAALPMLVTKLRNQVAQMSELVSKIETHHCLNSDEDLPEGYISPKELAARTFVTVKETAFLLNMSEKSVRRLIKRKLLSASKGLGKILIPVQEIGNYLKRTV
jgi:Helix-turn-helix domain